MTPQRIGSHYLLHEQIGQGGMGTVWRAEEEESGNWRAIKVLRPEYARDPVAVARFIRERNALLALRHPNVVTLHDMIVEGERLALVMELLTEGDLDKLRRDHGGTLPWSLATELTAQVCDGLAAAHAAGIVHRDIKPGNVLIDGGRARLSDFGIARIGGEAPVTTAGSVAGTVSYMAPEALTGSEPAPECDVYAVGVTLYELLTGQPPFTGQAATVMYAHLNAAPPRPEGLPGPLWNVIASCLAKDPAARPSAAELATELRQPQVFSEETLPVHLAPQLPPQPALQLGEPADLGALQAESAEHTITVIGSLSPAGSMHHQPAGPAALPPLAAGRPANRGGARKRLRTWGIAAAALVVVGAAAGAFTAFSPGSAEPAAAVAAASSTSHASATAAGVSLAPSPGRSSGKAAARPSATGLAAASSSAASSSAEPVRVTVTAQAPAASTTPAPAPATTAADPTPAPATTAPATPAPATTVADPAPSVTVTVSVSPATSCGAFPSGTSFWRCTGTVWQATSCSTAESNGTDGPFNVLAATNRCGDRVWLHQDAYPQDEKSGWAYCISPGASLKTVPAQYQHPLNIQVSANPAACLG